MTRVSVLCIAIVTGAAVFVTRRFDFQMRQQRAEIFAYLLARLEGRSHG